MIKKLLLFAFVAASNLLPAQAFVVADHTLSLNHAPNYKLDSTVVLGNGNPTQRVNYTYDFRERLVFKTYNDMQSIQKQVNTFNYDVNDSLLEKTYAAGAPTQTALTVMVRNAAKQVEYDTVSYNSGSQYTVNAAASYTYDTGGNLAAIENHLYTGSWAPLNRSEYQRNSAGKITYILSQGQVNSVWVNSTQNNKTYNSNNDLTDLLFQSWVSSSSSWKNVSRSHNAYTGAHLDTFTTYSWNNAWINNSRYTYSPAGPLDSVTIETWSGSQWDGYKRYVRTWAQGRLASVVEKGYTNTWGNAWKREYVYDSNGNHTLTNFYAYNSPSNPWALIIVINHYFSASTVGLAEHLFNDTKTYPVPSGGMLYFNSALPVKGGTVYTASGQEVIRFQGASVDLSPVTPGVHYVKLLLEDGSSRVVKAIRE